MDKKTVYHYQLFFVGGGNMVQNHFINTEINLLEMYKFALISGATSIMWENGVINMELIAGIVDTTPKVQ